MAIVMLSEAQDCDEPERVLEWAKSIADCELWSVCGRFGSNPKIGVMSV
jgi:hypothetical protein